jgi:hypothetical protein
MYCMRSLRPSSLARKKKTPEIVVSRQEMKHRDQIHVSKNVDDTATFERTPLILL